jgi:hypothetical protein
LAVATNPTKEETLDLSFSTERFEEMQRLEQIVENEACAPSSRIDALLGIARLHRQNRCYLQAEEITLRAASLGHKHGLAAAQFNELGCEVNALRRHGTRSYGRLYGIRTTSNPHKAGLALNSFSVEKEVEALSHWHSVHEPL